MRTGWYLAMVLASVVLAIAAVWLARRLTARFGPWYGRLLAAGAYLVAIAVVMVLLPTVDETGRVAQGSRCSTSKASRAMSLAAP